LLSLGLDARLLEATIDVLLESLDSPHIAPKHGNRRGNVSTFVSPGDRIIGDVEQDLKILCEHDTE
jgi:hypothetical protein